MKTTLKFSKLELTRFGESWWPVVIGGVRSWLDKAQEQARFARYIDLAYLMTPKPPSPFERAGAGPSWMGFPAVNLRPREAL